MNHLALFAQNNNPNVVDWLRQYWPFLAIAVVALFLLIGGIIFISFLRLWIQCWLTGAKIGILDLVGMKLRNVDYNMIVKQKIALVQAGVKVGTQELEAHYLTRGNVPRTAQAVIAAHKAGFDLPWRNRAARDLA